MQQDSEEKPFYSGYYRFTNHGHEPELLNNAHGSPAIICRLCGMTLEQYRDLVSPRDCTERK